jgi:hypothetical protein
MKLSPKEEALLIAGGNSGDDQMFLPLKSSCRKPARNGSPNLKNFDFVGDWVKIRAPAGWRTAI